MKELSWKKPLGLVVVLAIFAFAMRPNAKDTLAASKEAPEGLVRLECFIGIGVAIVSDYSTDVQIHQGSLEYHSWPSGEPRAVVGGICTIKSVPKESTK